MNDSFPKTHLESLWAPWRVEYFQEKPNPDFLEEAARASDDAAHFVITRRKTAFLMMNRYPYAVGHLMVVPYRKVSEMAELTMMKSLNSGNCASMRSGCSASA